MFKFKSQMIVRGIIYTTFSLMLTACDEGKYTADYLLEHPAVLEQELQFCMSASPKSEEQISGCKIAVDAQDKIRDYLDEQQMDPEKFGLHILNVEMACAQLKSALDAAGQAIVDLKAKKASGMEIQTAQARLAQAKQAYRDKQHELQVLLAVAGLSGPE